MVQFFISSKQGDGMPYENVLFIIGLLYKAGKHRKYVNKLLFHLFLSITGKLGLVS